MTGTSSPGLQALLTSADPTQMLERAVLLDAVGRRRSDVLAEVAVVERLAADASAVARTAWKRPPRSSRRPPSRWPRPISWRAEARQTAAGVQAQQAAMQTQLDPGPATLVAPAEPAERRASSRSPRPPSTAPAPNAPGPPLPPAADRS